MEGQDIARKNDDETIKAENQVHVAKKKHKSNGVGMAIASIVLSSILVAFDLFELGLMLQGISMDPAKCGGCGIGAAIFIMIGWPFLLAIAILAIVFYNLSQKRMKEASIELGKYKKLTLAGRILMIIWLVFPIVFIMLFLIAAAI